MGAIMAVWVAILIVAGYAAVILERELPAEARDPLTIVCVFFDLLMALL
jgi:hypothetical protein